MADTCIGCLDGIANQLAHMDIGGCLATKWGTQLVPQNPLSERTCECPPAEEVLKTAPKQCPSFKDPLAEGGSGGQAVFPIGGGSGAAPPFFVKKRGNEATADCSACCKKMKYY